MSPKIKSSSAYQDTKFKSTNLDQAVINSSEFVNCSFEECSFKETIFEVCEFQACIFLDCDLSLFKPPKSVFRSTRFSKSKLLGVSWTLASWGTKEINALLKSIEFNDCLLNYSSFFGLQLESTRITDCVAQEADFAEANLAKSDLRGTDFLKAIFRNTDLSGANLVGAKNYFIDPTANKLKEAHFSLPEAMGLLYAMDIHLDSGE
jgi:fluoroquinolone resistance protein